MVDNIFEQYLNAQPIFKSNREILTSSYIPDKLPHREREIDMLASILVSALKGAKPSNVLIHGLTGTGKTAVAKYMGKELKKVDENNKVEYVYINCVEVNTSYGVLQRIGNRFVSDWETEIPFTGWSLEKVYNMLKSKMDEHKKVTIVVLDEIDKFVCHSGDEVLYLLTMINEELKNSKLSLIEIANDLKFTELLDSRVRSRLGEEKMVFSRYDASQIKDILTQRANLVFVEGAVDDPVISLCAAYAAQENGDARRALDLLRVAGEIAERMREPKVTEYHVGKAKKQIELDCIAETIRKLPSHSKVLLWSIIMASGENGTLTTGDVYRAYKGACKKTGLNPLTQRRITDLLSEMDSSGLIQTRVRSFGREGRTKEIRLSVSPVDGRMVLEEDDILKCLCEFKPKRQTVLTFE